MRFRALGLLLFGIAGIIYGTTQSDGLEITAGMIDSIDELEGQSTAGNASQWGYDALNELTSATS
jgi:hypothetical protein